MGKSLSKYIFENVEQEPVFENSEISEMRKIIQTEGPTGLARHIDIKYKSWKEEPIKFGIAGKPNTGKSSFINAILNVKDDDEGVDQVDSCESITTPRKYCHPIEKQLLFFELPGIGSENWKKCEYVSKTQLWEYDYFFIVFDTVLYEDDLWLAQQLVKMKKPFVLVRSKVDRDIERGCGEDVSCILKKLREGTFSTINKIEVLQANIGVCFISSVNEDIGEMEKLKNHIILNLKSKKYETILYALNGLSKEIIKTKYILLKRRILVVTAAVTSVSAINLSGIEVGVNISILAREMYYYINELGLCRKERESLINVDDRQVKCRELLKTNCKLVRYILQQSPKLVAVIAVAVLQYKFEIFGPIVGVLISSLLSGPIAYNFLTNILENLTQDSIIGYDHVVSRHVPRKTSIHALLQLPDGLL